MRIAISGGDGFLGRNAAALLETRGHQVVRVSRRRGVDLSDIPALRLAFAGCDVVVHAAGINRELGSQTFERVHLRGTEHVIAAAKASGVGRLVYVSFLRARPRCGSRYHESKWAAEECVRSSGIDFTILKPGIVFGPGDHMLDHLARALRTFPVFALVGSGELPMSPVAVADVAAVIASACEDPRLSRRTVAVVGPERISLRTAAARVAKVLGVKRTFVRLPVWMHRMLASLFELTMVIPLAAKAQVRILSESLSQPAPECESLPADSLPRTSFDADQIRAALPPVKRLSLADFRCAAKDAR